MPVGFVVSVLIASLAVVLSLWPRGTRGPRATPSFIVSSIANELPFLVVYWLLADTALAVSEGDVDAPLGWIGLVLAACTLAGSAVVIWRASRAGQVLDAALTAGLGGDGIVLERRPRPFRLPGRVLVAPLRIPAKGVHRQRDINYGPSGRANRLDVYRHRSEPTRSPVLVYFHPGGFFSGNKSREARALFDRLVRSGWVCISANYRLGAAGTFPNNIVDAKRVIAWVRDHADDLGADPTTIVISGASAGAYLASMCALTAGDPIFQPGFEEVDTTVSAAAGFYGFYGSAGSSGPGHTDPVSFARADAPPFLVIHGDRDPMIPAENARRFVDAMRAVSTSPVVYAELPGGQHNFDRFPSIRSLAVLDAVEAFGIWIQSGAAS